MKFSAAILLPLAGLAAAMPQRTTAGNAVPVRTTANPGTIRTRTPAAAVRARAPAGASPLNIIGSGLTGNLGSLTGTFTGGSLDAGDLIGGLDDVVSLVEALLGLTGGLTGGGDLPLATIPQTLDLASLIENLLGGVLDLVGTLLGGGGGGDLISGLIGGLTGGLTGDLLGGVLGGGGGGALGGVPLPLNDILALLNINRKMAVPAEVEAMVHAAEHAEAAAPVRA